MANLFAEVKGVLVGFERRAYSSFTDRETGEVRPGGETLWVYVAPDDGQDAPTAVRFAGPDALKDWSTVHDAGFGARCKLRVEQRARNNQIVTHFVGVGDLTPAK